MRKGLELLSQINEKNYALEKLLLLQQLPKSFKLYLTLYRVGDYSIRMENICLNNDSTYTLTGNVFQIEWNGVKYENQFINIFSYEELIEEYGFFCAKEDDWSEEGFLSIGYLDYHDKILIGMNENNYGEIWRYGEWMIDEMYVKLSDNIFSFFSKLKENLDIELLEEFKIKTYELHKTWGRTFWQVKKQKCISQITIDVSNNFFNKKGLELLKQRTDFPESLKVVQKKLPPKMSLFLEYFNNGSYEEMLGQSEYVTLPNVPKCFVVRKEWFAQKYFEGEQYDNSFDHLLSLDEIKKELKQYDSKVESWHKEGLVKIGFMSYWDIIFLGVEEHNLDEIWVFGETIPTEKPYKFSSNIFDFFTNVEQFWSDEDLKEYTKNKIEGKDLYKKWGESFWRIKPNPLGQ